MRVGLVLGAGGLVGASWLIGALEALESETGWAPAEAEFVVGTSAGSVVGALTAGGHPAGPDERLLERARDGRPGRDGAARRGAGGAGRGHARDRRRCRCPCDGERSSASSGACPRSGRAPGGWRSGRWCIRCAIRPRRCSGVGCPAGSSPPSRSASWSRASSATGPITRASAPWPPTTPRGAVWRSARRRPRRRRPARRLPPRVRSPPSTTRSRSARGVTSTAASARRRTSTCCVTGSSTSCSA